MTAQLRTGLVSKFICLADKCEDTCCKHWSMQVDSVTFEKYQKEVPELLLAIDLGNAGDYIMKKDAQTGCCVKLLDGKCQIQSKYGEELLGDACALYPRISRTIGDTAIMTATISCPEIARIALYNESSPFAFDKAEFNAGFWRLPQGIKNVLPVNVLPVGNADNKELSPQDALPIHAAFLAATEDKSASAEHIFTRILSVANSLQLIGQKDWLNAAPLYLRLADGRLPTPENNINDPFNLLHALCGLVVASKKNAPPRLKQTIVDMEHALHANLDWQNVGISTQDDSLDAYNSMQVLWKSELQEIYSPILKRWLAAQLSAAFFPFAGLGINIAERAIIIGVRFAILRLAIMSAHVVHGAVLSQEEMVRIVQSLSRFLDHLANPAFFLQICAETGWSKESRMRGLLL